MDGLSQLDFPNLDRRARTQAVLQMQRLLPFLIPLVNSPPGNALQVHQVGTR
jgi:hypothetical protein